MRFPPFNRALLPGILAGSVVLMGTACSRPDRTESGSNGSTVVQDSNSSTIQPAAGDTATGTMSDTAAISADSGRSAAPKTPAPSTNPRAETAVPGESDAAGYRPMDRDTGNVPEQQLDSARVWANTSQPVDTATSETVDTATSETVDTASAEIGLVTDPAVGTDTASADTAAAGYVEMARDTSTVADQADTAATATTGDVALQTSTDSNTIDTSVQSDTEPSSYSRVAVSADSSERVAVSADSSEIVRVRPPEDSTELLGNVTSTDDMANETADEQVVDPDDQEKVAASETSSQTPEDEFGAAAVASDVTGAEAVALMTREGVQCAVVDQDTNEAVRWDMSSTPVALNPCGMGSMVLSRIRTEQ